MGKETEQTWRDVSFMLGEMLVLAGMLAVASGLSAMLGYGAAKVETNIFYRGYHRGEHDTTQRKEWVQRWLIRQKINVLSMTCAAMLLWRR